MVAFRAVPPLNGFFCDKIQDIGSDRVKFEKEAMIWHSLGAVIRANWEMVSPMFLQKYAGKHLIANTMNILQELSPIKVTSLSKWELSFND